MFVRVSTVKRNGKTYEYAQLVRSVRRDVDGRPTHQVVANLGRLSSLEIANLKASFEASRRDHHVVVARASSAPSRAAPKPRANLRYLDVAVVLELWRRWGLDVALREVLPERATDTADIVAALAIQRCVAPDSKLAATRWFANTALPELLRVKPKQFNNTRLHRVLDDLDRATPGLFPKLAKRYAGKHGAFAHLFLDVTDTWFVGHGPSVAQRGKTKEGLKRRKIGIVLLCDERGYPLRWDVIPGNQHDSVTMMSMLRAVSSLSWVGDAPIVVDRAMGTTALLHKMSATGVRFLTAITRNEFAAYAPGLPQDLMAQLAVTNEKECEEVTEIARERIHGDKSFERVADDLFVADLGVVERKDLAALASEIAPGDDGQSDEDLAAHAMRMGRDVELSVADGRFLSVRAAAASLGLKKGVAAKYRKLRRLPEDVQQAILTGTARSVPLAALIRVAEVDGTEAQREAFAAVVESHEGTPRRAPAQPKPASAKPPKELRLRVVAYFNPERFAQQRWAAHRKIQSVHTFVEELNERLRSPRARQTRQKILATIDRRLRRDDLIEAFHVEVEERFIEGHARYQAKVEVDQAEWRRRRSFDGFSVLVAHPDVPNPASELCRLYRAKDIVEKDFQVIKSVVEVRPVRHRTDEKVRAHVTLCMLALLLERSLRDALAGKLTSGAALESLESCRLNLYAGDPELPVYTTTELDKAQRAILRTLNMDLLADDDHLAERIEPR